MPNSDLTETPGKFFSGYFTRLVHTGDLTIAHWRMIKGATIKSWQAETSS